jgi:hypothetical protein
VDLFQVGPAQQQQQQQRRRRHLQTRGSRLRQ